MAEPFEVVSDGAEGTPPVVVLRCHVRPGAGRSQVVGRYGDALALQVAPPPADGRANAAVVSLLADTFGVAPSAVELVSGDRSRDKRVRLTGVAPAEVRRLLASALDEAERPSGGRRARRPGT